MHQEFLTLNTPSLTIESLHSPPISSTDREILAAKAARGNEFITDALTIRKLYQKIIEEPEISLDDLLTYADTLTHQNSEIVYRFVQSLIRSRDFTIKIIEHATESKHDNETIAESLYRSLMPKKIRSRFTPKAVQILNFPLCVILLFSDPTEREMISVRGDASLRTNQGFNFTDQLSVSFVGPIITVANEEFRDYLVHHEKEHLTNYMIQNALLGRGHFIKTNEVLYRQHWGAIENEKALQQKLATVRQIMALATDSDQEGTDYHALWASSKLLRKIKNRFTPPSIDRQLKIVEMQPEFDEIVNVVMSWAKDEIIVDISLDHKSIRRKVGQLMSNLYDYFIHQLHMSEDDPLYHHLRRQYLRRIMEKTKGVVDLHEQMQDLGCFSDRFTILQTMLAFTPIDTWDVVVTESGFKAEIDLLEEMNGSELFYLIERNENQFDRTFAKQDLIIIEKIREFHRETADWVNEHQDASLLSYLIERKSQYNAMLSTIYVGSTCEARLDKEFEVESLLLMLLEMRYRAHIILHETKSADRPQLYATAKQALEMVRQTDPIEREILRIKEAPTEYSIAKEKTLFQLYDELIALAHHSKYLADFLIWREPELTIG